MSSLSHETGRYRTELLPGWRGKLIRWMLRSLVRSGHAAEVEHVAMPPTIRELFDLGDRQMFDPPTAPSGPTDRYDQPVTPQPIPFVALADKRAAKYVYKNRRRFASAEGDIDNVVPAGATDAVPISTRSRR